MKYLKKYEKENINEGFWGGAILSYFAVQILWKIVKHIINLFKSQKHKSEINGLTLFLKLRSRGISEIKNVDITENKIFFKWIDSKDVENTITIHKNTKKLAYNYKIDTSLNPLPRIKKLSNLIKPDISLKSSGYIKDFKLELSDDDIKFFDETFKNFKQEHNQSIERSQNNGKGLKSEKIADFFINSIFWLIRKQFLYYYMTVLLNAHEENLKIIQMESGTYNFYIRNFAFNHTKEVGEAAEEADNQDIDTNFNISNLDFIKKLYISLYYYKKCLEKNTIEQTDPFLTIKIENDKLEISNIEKWKKCYKTGKYEMELIPQPKVEEDKVRRLEDQIHNSKQYLDSSSWYKSMNK